MLHGQRNDSGSTVAKGQTLHDTQDTDAVEGPCGFPQLGAEADALRGRNPVITEPREPADTHTNEEDEYGFRIFMPAARLNSKLYFFREMYVEIPMMNMKNGNTRSVGVRPFHSA